MLHIIITKVHFFDILRHRSNMMINTQYPMRNQRIIISKQHYIIEYSNNTHTQHTQYQNIEPKYILKYTGMTMTNSSKRLKINCSVVIKWPTWLNIVCRLKFDGSPGDGWAVGPRLEHDCGQVYCVYMKR